jgi:hypothetical protein
VSGRGAAAAGRGTRHSYAPPAEGPSEHREVTDVGFFDKLKKMAGQAEDLVEEHDDQILDGIDKAADVVDDKTKHKYADKIDKGVDAAKEQVEKVAEDDDMVKRSGKKKN